MLVREYLRDYKRKEKNITKCVSVHPRDPGPSLSSGQYTAPAGALLHCQGRCPIETVLVLEISGDVHHRRLQLNIGYTQKVARIRTDTFRNDLKLVTEFVSNRNYQNAMVLNSSGPQLFKFMQLQIVDCEFECVDMRLCLVSATLHEGAVSWEI